MNLGSFISPLFKQSKKVSDEKIQNDITKLCEELTNGIIELSDKAKKINELKDKYSKSQSESQTEESDASEKPEEKKTGWFSGFFSSNEKKKDDTQDNTSDNTSDITQPIQPVDELSAASTVSGSPESPASVQEASLGDSSTAFDSLASTADGSSQPLVEPLSDTSKAAQFSHFIVLAVSELISHISANLSQWSPGSLGLAGP